MATASSISSYKSANTQFSKASSSGSAFRLLFQAIDDLETISNLSSSSYRGSSVFSEESASQVTVTDVTSQFTVKGFFPGTGASVAQSTQGGSAPPGLGGGQMRNGLPKDNEGIETRKQMLERRRKECAAEEVDVALAPVMKINVPYCFYPAQYKAFRAMFPRVNVDSGLSYTHHDHPVAHTATMVGIRHVQGMFKPGELVLDLHGNPNGNEQFNNFQSSRLRKRPHLPAPPSVETLVEEKTSADAVRKLTKWGPEFAPNGDRRWYNMDMDKVPTGKYDTFTSIHTLYYYSMYEVCKFMNKHRSSRLLALVNYTKEQTGTLYGELSFSKSGGTTIQKSPNGESYLHPDIDQWFQTNSFRPYTDPFNGGIAWTSIHVGGPLYVIVITRCEWNLARTPRYDPPGAPTLRVEADRSFLGLVRIGGKDVRLRITNADLAAELRHFMIFRDRSNPQVFQDLVVKARRITSPDIVDGSRQYKVNDGELQDHIVYAFLVDAPGELELLDGVKLLRGDILIPLAEALRQQGPDKQTPLLAAMFQWMTGQSLTKGALGQATKGARPVKSQNSGGLLPLART